MDIICSNIYYILYNIHERYIMPWKNKTQKKKRVQEQTRNTLLAPANAKGLLPSFNVNSSGIDT